jgi:hypothetical protein
MKYRKQVITLFLIFIYLWLQKTVTYVYLVYNISFINKLYSLIYLFQADAARIGILADQMRRLLRKFLGKFVKNAVIAASSGVTAIPYEDFSAQLSNELMAVGTKNRTYLVEFQDHIGIEVEQKFFRFVYFI